MARVRTLTNLIAEARAVSDLHVTDAQVTEFINQGITEFYEVLEVRPYMTYWGEEE